MSLISSRAYRRIPLCEIEKKPYIVSNLSLTALKEFVEETDWKYGYGDYCAIYYERSAVWKIYSSYEEAMRSIVEDEDLSDTEKDDAFPYFFDSILDNMSDVGDVWHVQALKIIGDNLKNF